MRTKITREVLCIGICLLFFLSCKKDREVADYVGDYEISGKVLDEISGKPIPYAWVGVLARKHGQTSYLGTKSVVTVPADAEGNFHLKFYADATENYYDLSAESITYFNKSPRDPISFTKNGSRNQNIQLLPYAYLTYIIKGNKGGLYIHLSYQNSTGPFMKGVDTLRTVTKLPNREITVGYKIYNSSHEAVATIRDTIFTKAHDTTYYLIEF